MRMGAVRSWVNAVAAALRFHRVIPNAWEGSSTLVRFLAWEISPCFARRDDKRGAGPYRQNRNTIYSTRPFGFLTCSGTFLTAPRRAGSETLRLWLHTWLRQAITSATFFKESSAGAVAHRSRGVEPCATLGEARAKTVGYYAPHLDARPQHSFSSHHEEQSDVVISPRPKTALPAG